MTRWYLRPVCWVLTHRRVFRDELAYIECYCARCGHVFGGIDLTEAQP